MKPKSPPTPPPCFASGFEANGRQWVCTMAKGHEGEHVATGRDGTVLKRWAEGDLPSTFTPGAASATGSGPAGAADRPVRSVEWIPVEEQMPDDCTTVLLCVMTPVGGDCEVGYWHSETATWNTQFDQVIRESEEDGIRVSHWADFPETPAA